MFLGCRSFGGRQIGSSERRNDEMTEWQDGGWPNGGTTGWRKKVIFPFSPTWVSESCRTRDEFTTHFHFISFFFFLNFSFDLILLVWYCRIVWVILHDLPLSGWERAAMASTMPRACPIDLT